MKVKTQRVKKEILKTLDLEKKKEETPIDSDNEDDNESLDSDQEVCLMNI